MSDMHGPMKVERVRTEWRSHVEPPLDDSWSLLDKLRWHAGVIEADSGLRVLVDEVDNPKVPDVFQLKIGDWSTVYEFHQAWTCISTAGMGAEAMRPQLAEAWLRGAEYAWRNSGEGWNGEYNTETGNDMTTPFAELHPEARNLAEWGSEGAG